MLLNALNYTIPLSNPVLIFTLILLIILFAPIVFNKLRVPHLIGLIVAGAIIGPYGLNLMLRDSSIELFGTVGLLYLMFLAGLGIDINDFKKNSSRSLVFGLYTFIIPMVLGILAGRYLLHFSMQTSVLLASMFASHTLITYPIASKFGVVKNRAVTITVGGTIITDTLALLVLAAIASMATGQVDSQVWIRLGLSVVLFSVSIMVLFPIIGRWFLKHYTDSVSPYIFVLAMAFLGSSMAQAAGVEGIIGAFLAGLALNRLIPRTSALMNRVEFVGNALFIPFFLIGVGMLIDYRVFFKGFDTIKVALVMIVVAAGAKFLAAWLTQKTFRFTPDERRLIFGLSNSQAAATLAAVMVGYNIILNQPQIDAAALQGITLDPDRLLNDNVLNGTILMILVTCTLSSFVTQKGAQNIAISDASDLDASEGDIGERILIPLNNPDTTEELINLSVTIKSKGNHNCLHALNVIDSSGNDTTADKKARKLLDKASTAAIATDNVLNGLLRYDTSATNGITSVVREYKITDIILGITGKGDLSENFLGGLTEGVLSTCNTTTLIYKSVQPLATIKRHLVIIPDRAEREVGFPYWIIKVWNIARNTGAKLRFYGSAQTLDYIKDIHAKHPIEAEFALFDDWSDFLILSRDVHYDDNLLIILSRKGRPSYQVSMVKVISYLDKYFQKNNFLLIYPLQSGISDETSTSLMSKSAINPINNLDEIGRTLARLFRKK